MKNYLILFLAAGIFTFSSCSSDDDGTATTDDIIVGTWVLVDSNFPGFDVNNCPEDSMITLKADYTGNGTFYLSQNDCEPQISEGTWAKVNSGESVYSIEVPFLGRQEGEVTFINSGDSFSFSPQGAPGVILTFDRLVPEEES